MRTILGIIVACIALVCYISLHGENNEKTVSNPVEAPIDSLDIIDSICDEDDSDAESLNDIRFADFEDEDWLDNEYIRTLRQYIDDFNAGKIEDEALNPFRKAAKGKFVIYNVEPALMGGLFIMFTFIDQPEDIFSTWVYSEVNETTRRVTNYSVEGIKHEDFKNDMPREEILKIVNERPELKLF